MYTTITFLTERAVGGVSLPIFLLRRRLPTMANLNKVMLIGRLTRDPEVRTFTNGGKVANFGFAANNRKKNPSTGAWEDEPMFIDVKVFNRGENGRQADLAEQSLRKGHQVFLEGHLVLEQWDDKQTGQKRSKHVVYVDNFQFLERRDEVASGEGGSRYQRSASAPARTAAAPAPANGGGYEEPSPGMDGPEGHGESEIPF
jgi:single-strand DNA-binding protein